MARQAQSGPGMPIKTMEMRDAAFRAARRDDIARG